MGVQHYDKQFKAHAVKLSEHRGNISEVARELGISGSHSSLNGAKISIFTVRIVFPGEVYITPRNSDHILSQKDYYFYI